MSKMVKREIHVIKECACQEARNVNIDLKASVSPMGNAFLNGVETSQKEVACLVFQLSLSRMSIHVLFLHTAYPDERTFVLKDYETTANGTDSPDMQSYNILSEYERRPKYLENYYLADFPSLFRIVYLANKTLKD